MIMEKKGIYSVVKEGSKYKVKKKRTVVGTYLLLSDAKEYMDIKINNDKKLGA